MNPEPRVADIVTRDEKKVRAECLVCMETHVHDIRDPDEWPNITNQKKLVCSTESMKSATRVPIYDDSGNPTNDDYGWEFDREHLDFATVNAEDRLNDRTLCRSLLPQFKNLDSGLEEHMDSLSLTHCSDSPYIPTTTNQDVLDGDEALKERFKDLKSRQKLFMWACENLDLKRLRELFNKYPYDGLALHCDNTGRSGVRLAAVKENAIPALKILRRFYANLNSKDHYGRTPLMEAALWGRFTTVVWLMDEGASVTVEDANHMNALDLAAVSQRNLDERQHRAGTLYREPANADAQRRRIERHLRQYMESAQQRPASQHAEGTFFQMTKENKIHLCRSEFSLNVPQDKQSKAFAVLDRGPGYPQIRAMSGYSQENWKDVINNKLWSNRANQLRISLGLPDTMGFAAHAESQLLAFILWHHSLHDIPGSDWEIKMQYSEKEALERVKPAYTMTPTVTVSKSEMCDECRRMKNKMYEKFPWMNVSFRLVGDEVGGSHEIVDWEPRQRTRKIRRVKSAKSSAG